MFCLFSIYCLKLRAMYIHLRNVQYGWKLYFEKKSKSELSCRWSLNTWKFAEKRWRGSRIKIMRNFYEDYFFVDGLDNSSCLLRRHVSYAWCNWIRWLAYNRDLFVCKIKPRSRRGLRGRYMSKRAIEIEGRSGLVPSDTKELVIANNDRLGLKRSYMR